MRHYILASHGRFALGIYESVKIIMGEQENVHILCGYVQGEMDIREKIEQNMLSIDKDDEIIACSDLLGGSVNNELMKYITRENFHLITGMNLPLLMNLFLYKEEQAQDLIQKAMHEVRNSILYCNAFVDDIEEEEF